MDRRATDWSGHAELVGIVRQVRRRWRLKVALRGAGVMLAAALGVFLVSAYVVNRLGFSPGAVLAARVVIALAVVALLVRFLFMPLRRRVSDEQVALYLEEHEPTLRASLISALTADGPESNLSPALARRTIETALQRCRAVEGGLRVERKPLRQASGVLGGIAVAGLLLFLVGPSFVRFGARAIFLPLRADAAPVYRVLVEPGDTSLARGADLPVSAVLSGFTVDRVDLVMRLEGDSVPERVPMLPAPEGSGYEVRLFDLDRATEYYIEAGTVRSPVFHVSVLELPYVEKIDLELHFPAYTGLEARVIEDGGDVAAPVGTTVKVRATPTLAVDGGRVVLSDGRSLELAVDSSGALVGEFQVRESGLYHVELQTGNGAATPGSPQYLIDVLDDLQPTVEFSKPGRDTHVTSVDEVFLEAKAQDDYGVRSLDLVYSVNGGAEQTVPLLNGGTLAEVTAGHTIYLEEMDLQPGDFVSYYARTTDVGPGTRAPVTSDIYFMEIRPFGRNYRQADAGGGGGGGGGGGADAEADGQLSQRQRELIAATFNMVRDREKYSEEEFRENLVTLSLAQEKLQEQALTLAQRLANRGVARDSAFRTIAQALPLAAAEMAQAAEQLRSLRAPDALPPEQRALLQLQRAEAAYREVQVRLGQQGGGGGGGGAGPSAEDLADLFGLELDKLQNQYETVQRAGEQGGSPEQAEVDETAARVRELARRLERENERMQQAMASQVRDGNAAANQRALADETEEAARQLERLSRQQSRPELAETARQLREAADAMRRSAAESRAGNAGASREALDRLREATRRLDRSQREGAESEAQQIAERARQLAEEGRQTSQQMEQLQNAGSPASEGQRLAERKEAQAQEVAELQRDLDELAAETRRDQPDASRRLQAASESVRRNRLPEVIRASRAATQPNAPREYVRQMEEQINQGLDELQQRTAEASRSFSAPEDSQGQESLDRTRDLVRGLESMRERTRQAMGTQTSNRQGNQDGQTGQPQAGGDQGGEEGGTQASGRLGERPGGQQQGQGQQGQAGQQQGGSPQGQAQEGQGQGEQSQGQQGQGQQGQGQQGQGQQGQGQQGARGQQGGEGQQGQPGQGAQGQAGQGQGQAGQEGQGGREGQGQGQGDQPGGESGQRQVGGPSGTGFGTPGTGWSNGGPAGGSPDPEAVRQLRAESRERLAEARDLRRELAELGVSTQELDRAIAELGRMDDQRVYADWEELQHIQSAIVDRMKEFEFSLRQTLEGEQARKLFLSGSGDVPPAYREMVERYYRELSEGGR